MEEPAQKSERAGEVPVQEGSPDAMPRVKRLGNTREMFGDRADEIIAKREAKFSDIKLTPRQEQRRIQRAHEIARHLLR